MALISPVHPNASTSVSTFLNYRVVHECLEGKMQNTLSAWSMNPVEARWAMMMVLVRAFGSAPSRTILWNSSMVVSCPLSLMDHATEHLGGQMGIEGSMTAGAEAQHMSGGVGSGKEAT